MGKEAGNETTSTDPPAPTSATPPPPPPKAAETEEPAGKTFDQDALNRIVQKEKADAERAATAKVLADLGVEDLDAAKATLAQVEAAREAEMSEAERARAAAEKLAAESQVAIAEARAETTRARLSTALLAGSDEAPGLRNERLEAALTLGLQKAMEDGENAVAEAVDYVRTVSPEWFAPDTQDAGKSRPPIPAPGKTGGQTTTKVSPGEPDAQAAVTAYRERAKNRFTVPGQSK